MAEGGADPRFFARSGPQSLDAVAAAAGSVPLLSTKWFDGVAALQAAGPREVSFLDNRRYLPMLAETRAGAVIVHPDLGDRVPAGAIALKTPEPYLGWARVAALFYPPSAAPARCASIGHC